MSEQQVLSEASVNVDAAAIAEVTSGVSGLYRQAAPGKAELRIDVDGPQPQMTVSGLITGGLMQRLHWIAAVKAIGPQQYEGDIWFRDGQAALAPHKSVQVKVSAGGPVRQATVVFKGGAPPMTLVFSQKASTFRAVEFEFDTVAGAPAVTAFDTATHPNRPAMLPAETLTIDTVYRRAGFEVSRAPDGIVPLSGSGANATWSNAEMHDAMQTFWSRFANKPQWATWVLFAAMHDDGDTLGGIMFDDIGPQHRQGTAIFGNSFISRPEPGDPAPAAAVARMRFWTAVHELGHSFNLAHAWQKTLQFGTGAWIPMVDEPEGRSFMNYPFRVAGGPAAFFADFAYRFSNQELLFMRHAPERFVEMGAAKFFDDHGFSQADTNPTPRFALTLRANRAKTEFEFLEPCVLELKLTNISAEPTLVRAKPLRNADRSVIIIRKEGGSARQWLPFARYCTHSPREVLNAGESIYDSVFVGAGRNGWDLSEPGRYTIQALVRVDGEDVVSPPLNLLVRPPRSYEEEWIAQDLFTDDVGRVMAFDGTREMTQAYDTLQLAAAKLPDRAIAKHAAITIGKSLIKPFKVLTVAAAQAGPDKAFRTAPANFAEGAGAMAKGLMEDANYAAHTLGHVDYKSYADDLTDAAIAEGDVGLASEVQGVLQETLTQRGVLPEVVQTVAAKRKGLTAKAARSRK